MLSFCQQIFVDRVNLQIVRKVNGAAVEVDVDDVQEFAAQLVRVKRVNPDDERGRGGQDLDQRRRKNRDEDVRVPHRVQQRDQGHAAVRQSRKGSRVEKKFVLRQGSDEKHQDVVNAQLLEEQGHAVSGRRDCRIGRRVEEEFIRSSEAESDRTSTFVRNVDGTEEVSDQSFESDSFSSGADQTFAENVIICYYILE